MSPRLGLVVLALLVAIACSKRDPSRQRAPGAPAQTLRIRDASNKLLVSLGPENSLHGRDGAVIGRFDVRTDEVIIGENRQALDGAITVGERSVELRLPIGTSKFELVGDELRTDGHTFGWVEGFLPSTEGMRRVGIALVAVPMLPEPNNAGAQP